MPETAMTLTGLQSRLDNCMLPVGVALGHLTGQFYLLRNMEGKRSRVVFSRCLWSLGRRPRGCLVICHDCRAVSLQELKSLKLLTCSYSHLQHDDDSVVEVSIRSLCDKNHWCFPSTLSFAIPSALVRSLDGCILSSIVGLDDSILILSLHEC